MRKIFIALLIAVLCVNISFADTLRERLAALDGITSIQEIKQENKIFTEKYIITFEQPLDWNGNNNLTFTQRVEIGFKGFDNINIMDTGGYSLNDNEFTKDDRVELAKIYDANFISVEYRFFSKSAPDGLSVNSTNLWEYLTDYNASCDFHNIISQLKQILSGKWIFTGVSKGGQAANLFAYYFPNDVNAYVSYVGPFCNSANDSRVFEALFTKIGNERYGAEQAQKYRDLLLKFQVEAIRERDYLQPRLMTHSESFDLTLRPFYNTSRDYEQEIVEFGVRTWQYNQNFESIDMVLNMSRENRDEYLKTFLELLQKNYDQLLNVEFFPYYVQAHKENGSYKYILKTLRDAVNKEGLQLYITEDGEDNFLSKMLFTDEQRKIFTFNPETRNNLIAWTETNTSNVIMLYGDSDPWYYGRLEEADNGENIYVFVDSTQAHDLQIEKMPAALKNEIISLLDSWLKDSDNNYASSSGCNYGLSGLALCLFILWRRKRA